MVKGVGGGTGTLVVFGPRDTPGDTLLWIMALHLVLKVSWRTAMPSMPFVQPEELQCPACPLCSEPEELQMPSIPSCSVSLRNCNPQHTPFSVGFRPGLAPCQLSRVLHLPAGLILC